MRVSLDLLADLIAESGCRNFEVIGAEVDLRDQENATISLIVSSDDLADLAPGEVAPEVRCVITAALQTAKVEKA